ncbi:hypothetical protein EDD86DRAFT_248931 [Gorgonomyces haynaldii]|nr:hypothetical protein EDD86DRAFT_248931 [Gorgonomyces haynaldii]
MLVNRQQVISWKWLDSENLRDLDPLQLLDPFLQVIKSGDTNGFITGHALNSIEKFIQYRIIDPHHPQLGQAISRLVNAATRCKFEWTDVVSEEVVLAKILRLLRIIALSDAGRKSIDDKGICEMVEVSFGMYFQGRVSELLRKSAEETLLVLTQILFERLVVITREKEHRETIRSQSNSRIGTPERKSTVEEDEEQGENQFKRPLFKPFGMPAICELVRVLVSLVDPADRSHTDTMHRSLALTLLFRGIEIGGESLSKWIGFARMSEVEKYAPQEEPEEETMKISPEKERSTSIVVVGANGQIQTQEGTPVQETEESPLIGHESKQEISKKEQLDQPLNVEKVSKKLYVLIVEDLCRYLFQILFAQTLTFEQPPSWNAMAMTSLVLKVLSSMFNTIQPHLMLQQEWFLKYLMSQCETGIQRTPKSQVVGEVRELFVETILQLCRSPSFFGNLYLHHDCNMHSKSSLFQDLMRFFCKFSFPDLTPVDRRHQAGKIPEFLHQYMKRDVIEELTVKGSFEMTFSPEAMLYRIERKKTLLQGTELFNASSKKGIAYFQGLENPLTPAATASFLFHTSNLSKKIIGEYLAKPNHVDVLQVFASLYDFTGRRIDEAMRLFLEKFRIPGEAQQIDRIMSAFSETYYKTVKDDPDREISTEDATGVLAFSIIMLNTDQHNPQIRRPMSFQDYCRNVRGLNNGVDFSQTYLKSIYDAIKQNEIVMAEERGGELGFNFQWKELLQQRDRIAYVDNPETSIYDKQMFQRLDTAEDMTSIQKAVFGLQQCAILADQYENDQIMDYIVLSLCRISMLGKEISKLLPEEDVSQRSQETRIDAMPQSIKRKDAKTNRTLNDFGSSYRAQVSLVFLFNLASDYSNDIKEGWHQILLCISNLFLLQLLPTSLLTIETPAGLLTLPRLKTKQVEEPKKPQEQGIFFSTLSQFLSLAPADDDQYEYDEQFDEKRVIKCIESCHIEALFADSRYMEEETLDKILHACISLSLKSDKTERFSMQSVFLLETIFRILIHNRDRIQTLWPLVQEHLSLLFEGDVPFQLIERCVSGILRLMIRLIHSNDIHDHLFELLHRIEKLQIPQMPLLINQILIGLLNVTKMDIAFVSRHPDRWRLCVRLMNLASPLSAATSFELASIFVSDHPESILSVDTFAECVDILISQTAASKEEDKIYTERAVKAVEKLYHLHLMIPGYIEKSAWFEFWLPVLSGLSQQCCHPYKEVRVNALSFLQRLLLSTGLQETLPPEPAGSGQLECLENVVFPLLDELLKPEIAKLDLQSIDETRLRAMGLLTKVYLTFLPQLRGTKEFERVWSEILDYCGRYIHVASVEGIQESLKNMLLVMAAEDLLLEPIKQSTIERVQKYCPGLWNELFPTKLTE